MTNGYVQKHGRAGRALAPWLGMLLLSVLQCGVTAARAEEVAAGTVMSAQNIDELKSKTLAGVSIGQLLTERQEWVIKNHGLKMMLYPASELPEDPSKLERTRQYSNQVRFDAATRRVAGFVAGAPFPEIDEADPNAGDKVVYNQAYGAIYGDVNVFSPMMVVTIGGEKGIETVNTYRFARFYLLGLNSGAPTMGDGQRRILQTLIGLSPEDIRGSGTFQVRYGDARFDDVYVYVRSLRRVRRLSSGSWADPVQGTDLLQDELFGLNAHPTWYKQVKLIEKRKVLAIVHGDPPFMWDPDKAKLADIPGMDFKNAPHWQPVDRWEPVDAYKLEITPEATHLLSKKVVWMSASPYSPLVLSSEAFDKKGEFWRYTINRFSVARNGRGQDVMYFAGNITQDYQRMHATALVSTPGWVINPPGARVEEFDIEAVKRLVQ
jgi:hypothetical protein